MKKKASIFIVVFIAAVAIAVFLLLNTTTKQQYLDAGQFDITQHYTDSTTTFVYNSFEESGVLATYHMGSYGLMDINNGYWLSYSLPNLPQYIDVKKRLAEEIKNSMNQYLESIDGKNISGINIKSSARVTDVKLDMSEKDISLGKYDNSFPIKAIAIGKIEFTPEDGTEIKTFKDTNLNVLVNNWRFWYIYRKMSAWVLSNKVSEQACARMPEYGIKASAETCTYAPITIDIAKEIIEGQVRVLESTFDRDGLCIYGCSPSDPDCDGKTRDGLCGEDGVCKNGCSNPDPDCSKCSLKDPYVNCSVQIVCGNESVWSKHEPVSGGSCRGTKGCPGQCSQGCIYENFMEDCKSGLCPDTNCPVIGTENYDKLVPPCMYEANITYEGGEYTGQYGIPRFIESCGGLGTKYSWSLIAEITCVDTKNKKPVDVAGFVSLPFKIRVHQYFIEREHYSYIDPCIHPDGCTNEPVEGGGGGDDGGEGSSGSSSGSSSGDDCPNCDGDTSSGSTSGGSSGGDTGDGETDDDGGPDDDGSCDADC